MLFVMSFIVYSTCTPLLDVLIIRMLLRILILLLCTSEDDGRYGNPEKNGPWESSKLSLSVILCLNLGRRNPQGYRIILQSGGVLSNASRMALLLIR